MIKIPVMGRLIQHSITFVVQMRNKVFICGNITNVEFGSRLEVNLG